MSDKALSTYRDQHFKVFQLSCQWHLLISSIALALLSELIFMLFLVVDLCKQGSRADQERLLAISSTLYVGNLSFFTTVTCPDLHPVLRLLNRV